MSAVPSKEVTTKQVRAVRFGFYTADEVRRLSVKQIVTPIIFDNLKNPVPNGLYDAAMGPLDQFGRCATCGLKGHSCPGHFGHVELPLTVYNPLIFSTLYRMMRCVCTNCHHFKLKQDAVDAYAAKLRRLAAGDLVAGVEARTDKTGKSKEWKEFMQELDDDGKQQQGAGKKAAKKGYVGAYGDADSADAPVSSSGKQQAGAGSKGPLTQHALEAMQDTVSELLGKMNTGKCQNCGAACPTVKRQGGLKLFAVWPSAKALLDNVAKGITLRNVLDDSQTVPSLEDAIDDEEKKKDALAAKAKGKKDNKAAVKKDDSDSDEDEDEDGDVLMGDGAAGKADGAALRQQEQLAEAEAADPDGKGGKAASKKAKKAALEAALLAGKLDSSTKYLTPSEVREHMRLLWRHEAQLLSLMYAARSLPGRAGTTTKVQAAQGYEMFFLTVLPVAPNKFRPVSKLGEEVYEHVQNVVISRVIACSLELQTLQKAVDNAAATQDGSETAVAAHEADLGRRMALWLQLQNHVCTLIDSTTAENTDSQGIRQMLEKKEGMFRKNMMGKRVNFAARSVISPDVYIGTGEIGVPPYFAKRLSFPERVTPWNVEKLRALVIAGPNEHPGAVAVEDEHGKVVHLGLLSRQKREALAKQLLSGSALASRGGKAGGLGSGGVGSGAILGANKIVYRHLLDGDLMLTNRQPTLHKPGLMAHKARVLRGERTIRMHYANCSTFNADFDGDEINLHLPQDQLGRAEGYHVVHADHQFIVPTDGKPIRGLIQDHVVSGTLLTKRGTFFNRQQYTQLVYVGCTPWLRRQHASSQGGGLFTQTSADGLPPIELEPPCVLKPRELWSGKQVVSTVVRHFTRGLPPLSLTCGSKVPASYWGEGSGEEEMQFVKGSLVRGCVDKNVFGKYGLVHAVQELYGGAAAGHLLSAFSRLFTAYLQWHGFTCGMDDLLLVPRSEAQREALLQGAEARALQASAELLAATSGGSGPSLPGSVMAAPAAHTRQLAEFNAEVSSGLGLKYRANPDTGKMHDMKGSGAMHALSSEVVKACLPSGQVKPFPRNCLSAMTITGAKGSLVNFSQISCLLGQQELEGRRPPRMSSGKTLPCFRAYDSGARSNGFIGDRFLTGLRPQEYYFHCMAGREGLVDTAVKTSRSGYLQRCLVKNLESLRVHYDGTVRDNCDASIVQLAYGEDGLDVTQTSYLKQYGFLAANAQRFAQQLGLAEAKAAGQAAGTSESEAQVRKLLAKRADALAALAAAKAEGDEKAIEKANKSLAKIASGGPISGVFPPSVLGATSEAFADGLHAYTSANADRLLLPPSEDADMDGSEKKKKKKKDKESAAVSGSGRVVSAGRAASMVDAAIFTQLMQLKFMKSLAGSGEAVGVLAAQSVGEPSTQMTLNTFHMAGRGEANVTLGIPRLREILMTAAPRIKTPVMTLPVLPGLGSADAQVLANKMRRLRLAECLAGIRVEEQPVVAHAGAYVRMYTVTLQFYRQEQYPAEAELKFDDLIKCFKGQFSARLKMEVEKESRKRASNVAIGKVEVSTLAGEEGAATSGRGGGGGGEKGEGAGEGRKKRGNKADVAEEDDDDGDEAGGGGGEGAKVAWKGGRGEAATYEGPDDEDEREVRRAEKRALKQRGEAPESDDEEEDEDNDSDNEREQGDAAPGPSSAAAAAAASGKKAAAGKKGSKKADEAAEAVQPDDDDCVDYANNSCQLQLALPLGAPKLLMLELVERAAATTMVRQTLGIDKVYVVEAQGKEGPRVQTDGVNFEGAWQHTDIVDVNRITTNDVHAMLVTYGVEAARATIMRECQSVFSAYGIGVDPRHLSLIADFMTHLGGYRACNRIGIESSVSPFLKMSFETAAHFLTDATLRGSVDDLKSPAARLCVGRVVEVGTGSVELVQQLPGLHKHQPQAQALQKKPEKRP